ncbi:MAG: peptide chain release factor N(5)-glutamine methyltransferase, partial [Gammaproteobacteria bacterium]|nr:peptide chain release factor N(5)-glutamine methyltransferase [Gammaproteobacteria bacterium]
MPESPPGSAAGRLTGPRRGDRPAAPPGAPLRQLLGEGTRTLAPSQSARLDAELLLCFTLGLDRAALYREPERPVDTAAARDFRALLSARQRGVPLAYLTGRREFFGRTFEITDAVLVPRPETEGLVELAIETCAGRNELRVLDLGTGSGALAVTLAAELDTALVVAIDRDSAALAVAGRNIRCHGVAVHRLQGDWLDALGGTARFDLVVANPPYVASDDAALTSGETACEPRLALDGGADGLDALRRIAGACVPH